MHRKAAPVLRTGVRPAMKLHQLRYLVAAADHGSVRRAARALDLSQAAVTQGLRELEADCEVTLLHRQAGGILLTPAGEELLLHARLVVEQLRQAEEDLARRRDLGAAQRLSIGVTPWVGQTLIARVLPAFRAELPHVQLELFDGLSALAYPRLRDGQLHFLIGRIGDAATMAGLQATPMFRYEMTVVARAGHPRAQARSIAELLDEDWLLNFPAEEAATMMDKLFVQHGLPVPRQRIHLAQSASLMLTLVRQTDMLTFCPWPLLETDGLRHTLSALPLREHFQPHEVGIVRRAHEALPHAAQRFIAHLEAQVRLAASGQDPQLRRVFHSIDLLDAARTP